MKRKKYVWSLLVLVCILVLLKIVFSLGIFVYIFPRFKEKLQSLHKTKKLLMQQLSTFEHYSFSLFTSTSVTFSGTKMFYNEGWLLTKKFPLLNLNNYQRWKRVNKPWLFNINFSSAELHLGEGGLLNNIILSEHSTLDTLQ